MTLPLLNDTPKYELKIPSTGKKVKYRPYLVKEEKILLMANESKDKQTILEAVVDTIRACTNNKINTKDLATFDLEYIFLKLRAKSVGENVTLYLPCSEKECKQRNEVLVNLDEVQCPVSEDTETIIKITDDISVEMKYPTFAQVGDDASDAGFNMIASCIKAILTNEEKILLEDESPKEVQSFLESMTRVQFDSISNWVQNLPQVEYTIEFDCTSCGEHNEIEVKGLENFF